MFHDLYPAGLQLVDDGKGVGLGAGQGKQVADQILIKSPDTGTRAW
ncbi:MAG TPA: hypothetical protein VMA97_11170 [Streptosporangiaceae bacterium]|nr:hypothetical protein [Streptosporangiaceae bacterium]